MIFGLPALLIVALAAWKNKPLMKRRLVTFGFFVCVVIITLTAARLHNQSVDPKERSTRIISACEGYKAKYGQYPKSLSTLVPEFLPDVPVARATLYNNKFFYVLSDNNTAMLWYIETPPYGKRIYSFGKKSWSYLD
jgi:hypothetical protein